ncbi:MAG TPA: sulfotransferase [Actinomycetota bacterium]|nr:sulfotransferase [Actinomycetota bacterium]
MPPVTVLYVAGTGRSGSTLLGNMLGQVPGAFSGGEINNLFKRGILEDWYCGCGHRFSSCGVWQAVLGEAFGPLGTDVEAMVAAGDRLNRVRRIPRLLASRGKPGTLGPAAPEYLANLDRLYRGISGATGSRMIVDVSKSPSYGYLLGTLPSVRLHVIHLVRDPRGTAFSWRRKRLRSDGARERYMQRMSLPKSAALWSVWNLAAEAMWSRSGVPYLRLRYEDLMSDPAGALRAALNLAGVQHASLDFVGAGSVRLDACHTISGNPMRLATGELELKPDLEWTSAMPLAQRLLVTALTAHSLARYGYPLGRPEQFSLSRSS